MTSPVAKRRKLVVEITSGLARQAREVIVVRALARLLEGEKMAVPCREFGISRKTVPESTYWRRTSGVTLIRRVSADPEVDVERFLKASSYCVGQLEGQVRASPIAGLGMFLKRSGTA